MKHRDHPYWIIGLVSLACAWWVWPGGAMPPGHTGPDDGIVSLTAGQPSPFAYSLLENDHPFAIRMVSVPDPDCVPLDVEARILVDQHGQEKATLWRVMDGENVQLECDTFYDVYYRCDAPTCYRLTVLTVRIETGVVLSSREGYMMLD